MVIRGVNMQHVIEHTHLFLLGAVLGAIITARRRRVDWFIGEEGIVNTGGRIVEYSPTRGAIYV